MALLRARIPGGYWHSPRRRQILAVVTGQIEHPTREGEGAEPQHDGGGSATGVLPEDAEENHAQIAPQGYDGTEEADLWCG